MLSSADRWASLIEEDWIRSLDDTPFLRGCREGSVSRSELEDYVVQQFHYSRHFTRYLCALLSNIQNDEHRRELTENLMDETGLGAVKGIPHSRIYRQMMEKMGIDPHQSEVNPETQGLIETMWQSCRNPNPAVGLGALCLGAEAIVPHVYAQIVHGFGSVGENAETLEFFHLHIGCDDEHALTMKKIIEESLTSPEQKSALRCAASRAISARTRFFQALRPEAAADTGRLHAWI